VLGVAELSLSSLFSTPTVATLAERIESMRYHLGAAVAVPSGEREELAF
jgi:hypothetical protein